MSENEYSSYAEKVASSSTDTECETLLQKMAQALAQRSAMQAQGNILGGISSTAASSGNILAHPALGLPATSWASTIAATMPPAAPLKPEDLVKHLPAPETVARSFACRIAIPGHPGVKMTDHLKPIQKQVGYNQEASYVQVDIVLDSYEATKASLLEVFRAYVLPGMTKQERLDLTDEINSTTL